MNQLIVGLGNPEKSFQYTRHNIGSDCVSTLITHALNFKNSDLKHQWEVHQYGEFTHLKLKDVDDVQVLLTKPQCNINQSGEVIAALQAKLDLSPNQIIVIHDDIDLPIGDIRLNFGRGGRGHNGIKDIDAAIGKSYYHLRIGIGKSLQKARQSTLSYVLNTYNDEERKCYSESFRRIYDYLYLLLTDKSAAANVLNAKYESLDCQWEGIS